MTRLPGASWVPDAALVNSPPVLTMALPLSMRSVADSLCARAGAANSVASAAAMRRRWVFMESFQWCVWGWRMLRRNRDYGKRTGDARVLMGQVREFCEEDQQNATLIL